MFETATAAETLVLAVETIRAEVDALGCRASDRHERVFAAWQHVEDELAALHAQLDAVTMAVDAFHALLQPARSAGTAGTA